VDAVLPGKVNDSVHRLVDATGKYGGEEKIPGLSKNQCVRHRFTIAYLTNQDYFRRLA